MFFRKKSANKTQQPESERHSPTLSAGMHAPDDYSTIYRNDDEGENRSMNTDKQLSSHYRHSQSGDDHKDEQRNTTQSTETVYANINEPDIVRYSKDSVHEEERDYSGVTIMPDLRKVQHPECFQPGVYNNPAYFHSSSDVSGNMTQEGKMEDYYSLDQPSDPSEVQEAQRLQAGGQPNQIPENAGCAHSNSDVAANTNEEGEMEDYYSVDQPTDKNQVQEAERFQPGADQNLNILQSGTGETYSQPAGIQAGWDYDYVYEHVPSSSPVSAHAQHDSADEVAYAEIVDGDIPPVDEDETIMQDNDTYG